MERDIKGKLPCVTVPTQTKTICVCNLIEEVLSKGIFELHNLTLAFKKHLNSLGLTHGSLKCKSSGPHIKTTQIFDKSGAPIEAHNLHKQVQWLTKHKPLNWIDECTFTQRRPLCKTSLQNLWTKFIIAKRVLRAVYSNDCF